MSKYKKAKKARQPNIPLYTSPVTGTGGGVETSTGRSETTSVQFDYTHIKKDLTRIFTLAGVFIAVLVGLAFILR
jgi:hypothetical protein